MAPVPDLGPPGKRPAHQGEALEVRPGFLLLLVERENFSEELLDDKGPRAKVGIISRLGHGEKYLEGEGWARGYRYSLCKVFNIRAL